MAGGCLSILHLDAVPGVGSQCIGGREERVGTACAVPEVDLQPLAAGIVIDLPDIATVGVACDGEHGAAGQSAQLEV